MEDAMLVQQVYSILLNTSILAGVPLLLATFSGLIISILQAVTQIQDQTLPQTVKIVTIALTLFFWGRMLSDPLFQSSKLIIMNFPRWIS